MTVEQALAFFGAAAFQWVNPKSWLICTSAAATFLDPKAGSALGQSAAFALTFVVAALPSILPWLAFGAVLQRWLPSERAVRFCIGAMCVLLAASVILLIHSALRPAALWLNSSDVAAFALDLFARQAEAWVQARAWREWSFL